MAKALFVEEVSSLLLMVLQRQKLTTAQELEVSRSPLSSNLHLVPLVPQVPSDNARDMAALLRLTIIPTPPVLLSPLSPLTVVVWAVSDEIPPESTNRIQLHALL